MRPRLATRACRLSWLVAAALLAACAGTPSAPGSAPGSAPVSTPASGADAGARGQTAISPAQPGLPARLAANPPQACLEAIEAFAEQASGNRVLLGPAAFASSDELVLTRQPVRDARGQQLDGRMPPPTPLVLRLSQGDAGCVLRQVPAEGGLPGAPAGAVERAAAAVADPVVLPACRCLRLPD